VLDEVLDKVLDEVLDEVVGRSTNALSRLKARLFILVSMEGCSAPSTLLRFSTTCFPSSSASFHRPWSLHVNARLTMLVSVCGCSAPSSFFRKSALQQATPPLSSTVLVRTLS
jgi:hypothetical protein